MMRVQADGGYSVLDKMSLLDGKWRSCGSPVGASLATRLSLGHNDEGPKHAFKQILALHGRV